jgi:hypothetical protein
VFLAVFSQPASKKRRIATNTRTPARQPGNSATTIAGSIHEASEQEDAELPPPDNLNVALEVPGELIDEGMEQHNEIKVQKAVAAAIKEIVELFGQSCRLSDSELREAREIFPKVCNFLSLLCFLGLKTLLLFISIGLWFCKSDSRLRYFVRSIC